MTTTTRWGFLRDYFTPDAMDEIDKLFSAFEAHVHTGGNRVGDPTDRPIAALSAAGGKLAPATTYYYRYAFRDQFGLETAASQQVSVTTAGPLPAPAAPVARGNAPTGVGTQPTVAGTLKYALTGLVNGNPTQLGPPQVVTISAGQTVTITLPDGSDYDHFGLWRLSPTATGYSQIAVIPATQVSFLDDFSVADDPCACDPQTSAPTTNSTNATSSAVLTLPASAQAILMANPTIKSWLLFSTTQDGVYGPSSLVHEVVEIDANTGMLTTSYRDVGNSRVTGSPAVQSETLTPIQPVLEALGLAVPIIDPSITVPDGSTFTLMPAGVRFITRNQKYQPTRSPLNIYEGATSAAALPNPALLPTVLDGLPVIFHSTTDDTYTAFVLHQGVWREYGGVPTMGSGSGTGSNVITADGGFRRYKFGVHDDGTPYTIRVPTAPQIPDAPSGTAGDGQVAVSWDLNADDGGEALTAQSIIVTDTTATTSTAVNVDPTATSDTVTGLVNQHAYTFELQTTNPIGTSPTSISSAPVTPLHTEVAGDYVQNLTSSHDSGTIVLTWSPPISGPADPPTKYRAFRGADDGTGYVDLGEDIAVGSETATFTNLTDGTAYRFSVRAYYGSGTNTGFIPYDLNSHYIEATPGPVTNPPSAPTGVQAQPNSDGSTTVTWTPGS